MSSKANQPVTEEQLKLAWRHMRKLPHWPATLEAALQHPTIGPCINGLARSLSRAPWNSTNTPKSTISPPPAAQASAPLKSSRTAHLFDARKAAANDLDDK